MKELKNINIKFYNVDEIVLPFVEIQFKGMDSKKHSALMLLDSGSSVNLLMTEMRVLLGKNDWLPNSTEEVVTVTNETTKVPCGKFQFEMDGNLFQEKFFFFENQHLMQINDMMYVGVLGNQFMQKYNLAIDYSDMTVHTSDMTLEKLKDHHCDFFVPMEYGLKYYNAPILTIKGKENNAIVIVDTGCDEFSISQKAIEECGLMYKLTGNTVHVDGPNGSVEAKECILKFRIADKMGKNLYTHSHQETAVILPHSINNLIDEGECDDDGKQLASIEGMIGCPFLARNGWILDFGMRAIYKI